MGISSMERTNCPETEIDPSMLLLFQNPRWAARHWLPMLANYHVLKGVKRATQSPISSLV